MDNLKLLLGLFLGFSCPLSLDLAQTSIVVPHGLRAGEGNSYVYAPGGRAASRTQFIYAKEAINRVGFRIRALRIRRDGAYHRNFGLVSYEMQVGISNNENDPAWGYSAIYKENRGKDFVFAMRRRKVVFPPAGKPKTPPAPFTVVFPFDRPFDYKGKALLLEFVALGEKYTSRFWYPDAQKYDWKGYPQGGSKRYFGNACPRNYYTYGFKPYLGMPYINYGYSRVSHEALGIDILGTNTKNYQSWKLPFDIGRFGAPGCTLYVAPIMFKFAFTRMESHTGYVKFNWGYIPNDISLLGAKFYEQQFVLDYSFNAFGLRASAAAECMVGKGPSGHVKGLMVVGYGADFSLESEAGLKVEPKALVIELVK